MCDKLAEQMIDKIRCISYLYIIPDVLILLLAAYIKAAILHVVTIVKHKESQITFLHINFFQNSFVSQLARDNMYRDNFLQILKSV